ncbi:MAG: anhydro-N-acetylmuramic acid kinase [Gammaproteobacteria bacterium]|nr:anhydro-N-acetylmuramic acid kinase [Gammaproteobacteria bacterium]
MSNLYIGLMSGTSLDGIDAAIVDFSQAKPQLVASYFEPYEKKFKEQLFLLTQPGSNEIDRMGRMDRILGERFAYATLKLLAKSGLPKSAIRAIGSHGQALRHRPVGAHAFTLQITDPNTLVSITGIPTVSDFRRADVAQGGQGAPLAPGFHQVLFADPQEVRVVLNLGGIANITVLDPRSPVTGFDTGPANRLLDDWIHVCLGKSHDEGGAFAQQGSVNEALLAHFLEEPYFSLPPPKSTGRECFDLNWLYQKLDAFSGAQLAPEVVQATLASLTAQSVAQAIKQAAPDAACVIVCGGGVHNHHLMACLKTALPGRVVGSSAQWGFDPDWMEAAAFAWLAKRRLENQPGNIPSVTGAKKAVVLGGIWGG